MRKISCLFFFSLTLLFSCQEDVDKQIQTNLPEEAAQLLDTSRAWEESFYVSLLPFESYETLAGLPLPGCPSISISSIDRTVELDYDNPVECEMENLVARKGKILLTYGLVGLENTQWTVSYEDYQYDDISVSGSKTISKHNLSYVEETFEDLTFETKEGLTTRLSGEFSHELVSNIDGINSIQTTGEAQGINPAGRELNWVILEPRISLIECINQGSDIPSGGIDNWTISRGPSQEVLHSLEYLPLDSCQVEVIAKLPDGRQLILNP